MMTATTVMVETATAMATVTTMAMVTVMAIMLPPLPTATMLMMREAAFKDGNWTTTIG